MNISNRSFLLLVTLLTLPVCQAQADDTDYGVYWDVPLLPITLHVGTQGIEVSGRASVVTPVGVFGMEATSDILEKEKPARIRDVVVKRNDLLLVVRNTGKWGDKIYKVKDGNEISVLTNSQSLVMARNGNVVVDVSRGDVNEINFAGKREVFGSASPGRNTQERASGRAVRTPVNETVPMELKIFYRRGDRGIFENLRNSGTLNSGDLYKIVFRASEDSYVYVFNTDDTGRMHRLFPMKAFKGVTVNNFNPIKRGKTYYIPSPGKSFRLDTVTGEGKILFLAMKKPDKTLESSQFEGNEARMVYLESLCEDCIGEVRFEHR
ncbi:DUF4384 domain-containing protein [Desulfococcaceae bacterium HSG8]|nr:DUF4384 domain-containing protein [Desulfococcaceae bacterium HSG8]